MFSFSSITFAWTQQLLRSKCLLHHSWVIFYCLFCLVLLSQQASAQNTLHITKALIDNGRELTPTNEAKPINLPHSWNSESPQKEGIATYYINFSVTAGESTDTLAVYMPRIGSRYEIYVNNELILSTGKLDDIRTFYTHKAGFVKIPTQLIFAGSNNLTIVIAGEGGRYAGLSSVYIGNYEKLFKQYESRTFYQTFSSLVIVIVCLFIGLVTLIYSVFAKNKYFFMFGIASLAWAANNSYLLLSYFPFNHRILLFFYDFVQAIGVALMCITVAYLVRIRVKWYASFAYGYLYFSFFCLIIYNDGHPIARAFFLNGTLLLAIVFFGLYFKSLSYRTRNFSYVTFASLLTALLLIVYDQLFVYHNKNNGYELINYSRYSMLLFILAIATNLANQFIKINRFVLRSRERMNVKLAMVKTNLSDSFSKRSVVERKLTLQQERWRLMQDMHDGIGHRLLSLQQAVQDPSQSSHDLNQMVKQTMTELRTTIQSISQPHENVSYMLGDLRERLDFLCSQYKKELQWSVDEIPNIPKIDEIKISHIEKIILEIFSNIAKHSCASWVKLTATYAQGESVIITVEENGEGYEGLNTGLKDSKSEQRTASHQRGLLGISRRAADIQARLHFQDKGRTVKLVVSAR